MTGPGDGDRRRVAGRYTLLSRLGVGGMGTVWRARDDVLGREVAVKEIVFPHGLPDDEREVLRERTRREARAAARLDHPSAVTVYDVVEQDGQPFLVMELVQARTLAEVVRSQGPLTPRRAAEVGLAVLGALQAAHARGIVHRDVKPGNVLLTDDDGAGRVVLTDFGIATSSGDASITSTGLILGSPSYIAPERCRGQSPGPASDLWSLGATLFTAVEGRPAYDAGDPLSTVTAVVAGEHAPFRSAGALQPVIEGLLERDPLLRTDGATARRQLEAVAADRAVPAPARAASAPAPAAAQAQAEATSALPVDDVRSAAAPQAAATQPTVPRTTSLPARPARSAPRRRSSALPLLLLALLLVVGGTVGGLALLGSGRDDPPAARAAPTPTAAAPSPTPTPTRDDPVEVERPAGVPAEWAQFTEPDEGWTLFHPSEYVETERGALRQFRDEQQRFTLRVDHSAEPQGTALEATQAAAASFEGALAGYQQLRLEEVAFREYDTAEVEFTWADPASGADLRVVNRTFVVDGRAYSLFWQVAVERFPESLDDFESLALAFVPAT